MSSHEQPPINERAHEARDELREELEQFIQSLVQEFPTLTFRQDEEYVIIGNPNDEHPVEVQILRSKFVPQLNASPISIRDYIRTRCEELLSEK